MKNAESEHFASLSLKDLLGARDQYHYHLMNKANVIGTAIGRYLIRHDDPWPTANRRTMTAEGDRKPPTKQPRTFEHSEKRDYSWPCVIVVVSEWVSDFGTDRGAQLHPSELVPKTLYLPDGRMVPVCIVAATPLAQQRALPTWVWPSGRLSPGQPIVTEHQRVEHIASIGCLVSDGHTTYAVTNCHVAGAAGEPTYAYRRGRLEKIGRTSDKRLTRVPFEQVYPDFPSRRTYLNADVGLVELDDLNAWTSQVFELSQTRSIGELVDLHEANLGLDLIDRPVRAHGAASGDLAGRIKAMFYRYKSVGGYDYVADFLIAPERPDVASTQEGDSGTVWHLQDEAQLFPLGVEWGAQALESASGRQNFALATSLASVCKLLDVELVHDVHAGAAPTWGQMGHYTIGAFATTRVTANKLKLLMRDNLDRISLVDEALNPKGIKAVVKAAADDDDAVIPLADVPDLVWKHLPSKTAPGGRDTSGGKLQSDGPEHPTHYADIDRPNPQRDGKTLRQICMDDPPRNVDVEVWRQFYTETGQTASKKRGLLPFRVWQFYDAMVAALRDKDLDKYIAAAGLVAHYVGDACQPLHGSMYADGYEDRPKVVQVHHERGKHAGEDEDVHTHVGAGVHSSYETHMLDRKAKEIVEQLPGALAGWKSKTERMANGQAVAIEVVKLMDRTATRLPPTKIIDAYVKLGDKDSTAAQDGLWKQFKAQTLETLVDGADVLAAVWDAAWQAGGGDALTKGGARDARALRELYENPSFVPSLDLDSIAAVLVTGRAADEDHHGHPAKPKRSAKPKQPAASPVTRRHRSRERAHADVRGRRSPG